MHPNPTFHTGERAAHEALIDQVGFGMVYLTTPDGPRVAHTPVLSTGDGAVQFHLARGNALTRHLAESEALIVVNGPEGYVSARWYDDADQVSTWNYVALEMVGRVRQMDEDGLAGLLEDLVDRHESRITAGQRWTMDKLSTANRRRMLAAITGFEMEVREWRGTAKLSQNKPEAERKRLIAGIRDAGSTAVADLMEEFTA